MVTLVNRAKVSTSTTGTGTITLGSAESGYQTFADAGVSNGDVVRYVIEDGTDWEIGTGTYTASGTTLSRTVLESSNSDAALNLTGSAVVYVSAVAEDIPAALGDGQTWTASGKGVFTTYQNTTGRTIAISVRDDTAQSSMITIKVGTNPSGSSNPTVYQVNALFLDFVDFNQTGQSFHTATAIVPDGHYYYITASSINFFMELI
jgi:hypothetical protein